ncbi:MAG: tRNA (guanine(10)-N(2))-dimethyltransferase [Candidatus Nanohaloarchaea archaeon]
MEERGWELFAPEEEEPDRDSDVFFNDHMLANRDISEVAFRVGSGQIDSEEIRACDAMAATGIRGFRYSSFADEVVINDSKPEAYRSIKRGAEANGIDVEARQEDANVLLSSNRNRFHLIDLDPFGPFTGFLDSVAQASNHESFVGLTATDNAVPAGSYRKTCKRRYGAEPLKNSLMHETGLRIYIREAFRNFARYDKCFEPKLCFHQRHYSRLIGRVTESKSRTNSNLENIGFLSFCPDCRWRELGRERKRCCGSCGGKVDHAGPLWTGKFSDRRFTSEVLDRMPESWEEARQIVGLIDAESEILTPYYDLHEMSSSIGISSPKRDQVIEAIREKGYPVERTHFAPTGFRTDAPVEDIVEIISEA